MRSLNALVAVGALALGCQATSGDDCPVGALDCPCTQGGGCDAPLTCLEDTCRSIQTNDTDPPLPTATTDSTSTTSPSSTGPGPTSTETMPPQETSDTDEIKLDVGSEDVANQPCAETGCKSIDLVFALDSSLSMGEEIGALAATAAFSDIVTALSEINCGDIDYRIGLTNDNDGGWIGAAGATWFDSQVMTAEEISDAFGTAAGSVLGAGGTPIACEHVLNSVHDLLANDATSFVREDALLVIVLVTDVDDYGWYDQQGFGGPCDGFLCTQSGLDPTEIQDAFVALKGGDELGVAAVVVAGDPMAHEGDNSCGQPASCCGGGLECGQAHQAPRVYEFASLQAGMNGYVADICDGAAMVPAAIEDALTNNIDLACQTFEPEG